MSKIASCFLINVKESDNVSGYDVSNADKKIKALRLNTGVYLCFIDEMLITDDPDDQFCEALYNNSIIVLRHRDIINLVV
jgi:hypothetical protein